MGEKRKRRNERIEWGCKKEKMNERKETRG